MNAYFGGYQGGGIGRSEGLSGDPGRTGENALGRYTRRGVRRRDEEHPWRTTSRWGQAWRVALGVFAVWLSLGLLTVLLFADGRLEYFAPDVASAIAALTLPPLICAALAAALSGWLRRYVPVTQAVVFGFSAYLVVVLLAAAAPYLWSLVGSGCAPGDACFAGSWPYTAFVALVCVPGILIAAIGYGLAQASVTWAGKRVFIGSLAATLLITLIYVVVIAVRGSGAG